MPTAAVVRGESASPEKVGTPITFEVDDPECFADKLKTLRGGIALLHALVACLGDASGGDLGNPFAAFCGAEELTEQLYSFVRLGDMDVLFDAVQAAADARVDARLAGFREARAER